MHTPDLFSRTTIKKVKKRAEENGSNIRKYLCPLTRTNGQNAPHVIEVLCPTRVLCRHHRHRHRKRAGQSRAQKKTHSTTLNAMATRRQKDRRREQTPKKSSPRFSQSTQFINTTSTTSYTAASSNKQLAGAVLNSTFSMMVPASRPPMGPTSRLVNLRVLCVQSSILQKDQRLARPD